MDAVPASDGEDSAVHRRSITTTELETVIHLQSNVRQTHTVALPALGEGRREVL